MINPRSTIITISFVLATAIVVTSAVGLKQDDESASNLLDVEVIEESTFDRMDYFALEDANKVMALKANTLRIVNQRDLYFTLPDGLLYNESGEKIAFQAKEGKFKDLKQELFLDGEVTLNAREGNYKAKELYYNGSKAFLEARGNIEAKLVDSTTKDQLKINSNYMSSWLNEQRSLFIGEVEGVVKRDRVYEGSFNFEAQRMELNSAKSLISLNNDVMLQRNNYDLRAQKAEIFLENYNKKLKYYVLYDDIKLVEDLNLPGGGLQTRKAYSEKLEGYMSQGKIVLTGAPRVEQGNDLIKGYQITLRENVEIVEVEEAQSSFKLKKKKD
ncbi:MAG: LPS export ABC transporter periplasmic protein LptC [Bacteriovoracaceae bacterium]|nr:LPS export ABC transporter periplasmic protein LptC [Bacteriovoracaceae bacterium]